MPVVYRDQSWLEKHLVKLLLSLILVIGLVVWGHNTRQHREQPLTASAAALPYLTDVVLALSPDGRTLAKAGVYEWKDRRETSIQLYGLNNTWITGVPAITSSRPTTLKFSPSGQLALATDDGGLRAYNLNIHKGKEPVVKLLWQTKTGYPVSSRIAWDPAGNGLYLFTTVSDGIIHGPVSVIQRYSRKGVKLWEYHSAPAPNDGTNVARRDADAIFILPKSIITAGLTTYTYGVPGEAWCDEIDLQGRANRPIWRMAPNEMDPLNAPINPSAVALSADGKTIFLGTGYGGVVVLDRSGKKQARIYQVIVGKPVQYIAVSPGGNGVAVSTGDSNVLYTNLNGDLSKNAQARKIEFQAEATKLYGLSFSEDGCTIIARVHGEPEEFDLP